MEKNYLRRNKSNLWVLIIYSALIGWLLYDQMLKIPDITDAKSVADFHFKILTANSIFGGFLFTNIGLMTNALTKEKVALLDKGGYLDNYYNSLYIGLFFHSVSLILSLIVILLGFLNPYLIYAVEVTLIGGLTFFIKSIVGTWRIINKIRK